MRNLSLLLIVLFVSCVSEPQIPEIDDEYFFEFREYELARQQERDYYLKLCGLTKLPKLTSSFGTDSLSDVRVDVQGLPDTLGFFSNQGTDILFISNPEVRITDENDRRIDTITYRLNEYGNSEKLFHEAFSWMIITRGGQPYVRSWDEEHPAVEAFEPFDRFPLTKAFIFKADFKYFNQPKNRTVSTQLGPPETVQMIGEISFEYQGTNYALEVGNNGFTMVGDATTGNQTYGGGRYIDLVLPKQSGPMVLDFNKLYNPPCTFSDYTTCQYPDDSNVLPFELKAGERYNGH